MADGMTRAMVERLPIAGGHIIVHTTHMKHYVRQMIADLRGLQVMHRTTIHVIQQRGDEIRLHGIRGYIEIDHAWVGHVHFDLAVRVNHLVDALNRIAAPALTAAEGSDG